jgi:methylmalonyl-CoA mutase N-terminal domain/subunit
VNVYEDTVDSTPPPILVIDPDIERNQVARVRALRENRDNTSVQSRLEELKAAVRNGDNTMPPILDAVRARATEGEIIAAMRDVFGTYRESPIF